MVEAPDDPSLSGHFRSSPTTDAVKGAGGADIRSFPRSRSNTSEREKAQYFSFINRVNGVQNKYDGVSRNNTTGQGDKEKSIFSAPAPSQTGSGNGDEAAAIDPETKTLGITRFYNVLKETLLSSWVNVLLVFVPVGIAVKTAGVDPTIVFAMNAIAIVPLAGLLSHATEIVANEMGDTIGALMNVTFGNAVELIIL